MLEEIALVSKVVNNQIWIETKPQSGCSTCSSSGCSSLVLAKLFTAKINTIQLNNHLNAKVGEKVVIGMSDKLLINAALRIYLLPLILMLTMTIISNQFGVSDGLQSLFALVALACGFIFVNKYSSGRSSQQRFKPELLRIASKRN